MTDKTEFIKRKVAELTEEQKEYIRNAAKIDPEKAIEIIIAVASSECAMKNHAQEYETQIIEELNSFSFGEIFEAQFDRYIGWTRDWRGIPHETGTISLIDLLKQKRKDKEEKISFYHDAMAYQSAKKTLLDLHAKELRGEALTESEMTQLDNGWRMIYALFPNAYTIPDQSL